MKAICIPAFNRPALLRSTLDSIPETEGWKVYLSLEHTAPKEIEDIALRYGRRFPMRSWKSGRQLGSRMNTFMACQAAIEDGAGAILSMDDDITLSPDALKLCDWYLKPERDPVTNAGLALCRKDANDQHRPNSISTADTWMGHLGQGYCFTKLMWMAFVARSFWVYEESHRGGADWAVCVEAVRTKRIILRPRLARARHAGTIGYHGPGLGVFPEHISDGKHTDYVIE